MKRTVLFIFVTIISCLLLFSASNIIAQEPCTADFDCNGNVDANDVTTFLSQFGRSPFNDPCPDCYDSPCPCTNAGCDPPAPVPKTGPNISIATGDDGDLQKGIVWPIPRFTDNLDGTVTDNLTNLVWLKDANCFGTRTWNDALADCNGLADGSCELTDGSSVGDWRLPNKKELISLTHDGRFDPALSNTTGTEPWTEGDPFIDVRSAHYWSSTSYQINYDAAWVVNMNIASVEVLYKVESLFSFVWPVRDRRCLTGETKPCGISVGECKYGIATCTDGVWGDCIGGVPPVNEVCNDGLDNDCDGTIDLDCCAPTNPCVDLGYECGSWYDGCEGFLDCGTCDPGFVCETGVCVPECLNAGETCVLNEDCCSSICIALTNSCL